MDFIIFYCILNRNSCKNSGDPDQTPRSAASGLGLHCLHMSSKGFPDLKQVYATFCVYNYPCRQSLMW